MRRSFLPLFTAPSIILNRKTTFHKINEKVVVEVPGKLIRQLTEICNGTRTFNEVVQIVKDEWDEHSVRNLIQELRRRNILVDSRYLGDAAWKAAENPSHFSSSLSEADVMKLVEKARRRHQSDSSEENYDVQPFVIGQLLEKRRSVRSFSGEPVDFRRIVGMLWAAYGKINTSTENVGRRTVPSAGALYPLMLHVALFKDTGKLHPGVYNAWMGFLGTVGFNLVSGDTDRLIRAFADPLMLDGSHGVIVVSGSFHVTGEKYGNRSMLYVTLEAGHVAQNIHLAASEFEVATVEIGGFVEELLAEAIELPRCYRPLTTVIFGQEADTVSTYDIETDWVIPMAAGYHPQFTTALARVSAEINEDWSYGRDATPSLARTKAVAEAREWAACGCVPDTLTQARFIDITMSIDPQTIIRFHVAQYHLKYFPFTRFNKHGVYAWAEGRDEITGSAIHILADHIYFPYYPTTPLYTYANSSGVAAHPDRQKAVETSTLELVERDAFMNAYLARLVLPTVSEKTLPLGIQTRIKELRKIGFRVWIKDHSLDLAPVMFVFAQNEGLAYTTCASCSSFDPEHAISHALMEVEASVLARLQNGPAAFGQPQEVAMPLDHGALYEHKQYFHHADPLIFGRNKIAFQDVGGRVARSWQELLDRFALKGWQLLTIPLFLSEKYGGNHSLHIIRSIVPGMVPMTFGYRQEPAGMERIYTVAKEFGNRTISYRDLPKFPHPFA